VSVIPAKTDTKVVHMAAKKSVRIIKKIREGSGVWRFVSLKRAHALRVGRSARELFR